MTYSADAVRAIQGGAAEVIARQEAEIERLRAELVQARTAAAAWERWAAMLHAALRWWRKGHPLNEINSAGQTGYYEAREYEKCQQPAQQQQP